MIHSPCGVSPSINIRSSSPSTFISAPRASAASRAGPPSAAPVPGSGYASSGANVRGRRLRRPGARSARFPASAARGVNGLVPGDGAPAGRRASPEAGPKGLRPLQRKRRIEARARPPRVAGGREGAGAPTGRRRSGPRDRPGWRREARARTARSTRRNTRPLVFEAHFGLGRVHVDVHRRPDPRSR